MPLTAQTTFVLVRPHYPENVGAAARAAKTMGITRLALVKPGRLARPEHEMAFKMAVKSWDVLHAAEIHDTLESALQGIPVTFGTTSRRGTSGVFTLRDAAREALGPAVSGERVAVIFGNEKTGLDADDKAHCRHLLRIPMAADQPSINLAQACQLVAYEFFIAGLGHRAEQRRNAGEEPSQIDPEDEA